MIVLKATPSTYPTVCTLDRPCQPITSITQSPDPPERVVREHFECIFQVYVFVNYQEYISGSPHNEEWTQLSDWSYNQQYLTTSVFQMSAHDRSRLGLLADDNLI